MKCNAAIAFSPARPLELVTIDVRDPDPGEVLVRMVATGICHSDIAVLDGQNPRIGRFPILLGHEGAGVVEKVGQGVTALAPGDHVINAPSPQCGVCPECMSGRSNLCQELLAGFAPSKTAYSYEGRALNRFMHAGTFTEFMVTTASSVAKIRNDAPLDKSCVASCCVATGVGASVFAAKVRPGDTVAVFGLGGVGLNAVQGARLCSARRIIAVDMDPEREAMARRFGATDFVDARAIADVPTHIQQLTGGGVDHAIEAVGHPEVIRQALACTRMGRSNCIVLGMIPDDAHIKLGPADLGIGRSLRVSVAGDTLGLVDTPKYVDWYMEGKLLFDEIISRAYPFEKINDAIAEQKKGAAIRNVIRFK